MSKHVMFRSIIFTILAVSTNSSFAQDWSGLYLGAVVGKSDIESRWQDLDGDWGGGTVGTFDADDVALGLQLGYNWQSGNLVYGVAGGFSYQDLSNTTFVYNDVWIDNSLTFVADIRGVMGYSFGNILPYATLGFAVSDLEHSWHEIDDTSDSWPDFDSTGAIVYGLGVDYAVSEKLSVGAQFLRSDYGQDTDTNANNFRMEVETEMDRVAITLNYHL